MTRFNSVFSLLCAAIICVVATPASAQVAITEVQKLYFGKWFFGGDDSAIRITVATDGAHSPVPGAVNMFTPPRQGVYNITGLPPFTAVNSMTVTAGEPLTLNGRSFTLENFTTQYNDANDLGQLTLSLGADLVTEGSGSAYPGGSFNGTLNIELDY